MSCLSGKRQFTGEGPRKAVYVPNLLPSLRFLRLVIFFFFALLLAVARAAVPQPPSLPNYHPHTDRQAADGGKLDCVHEEIQFSDETNALHRGGICGVPQGGGRGPGSDAVWDQLGPAQGEHGGPVLCGSLHPHPSCVCLSLY